MLDHDYAVQHQVQQGRKNVQDQDARTQVSMLPLYPQAAAGQRKATTQRHVSNEAAPAASFLSPYGIMVSVSNFNSMGHGVSMVDLSTLPIQHPLKIIIGAGDQRYAGWIATQKEDLDLLQYEDWAISFGERRADALLCEHVWEHLTEREGRQAAAICYAFLKPGGYLRCAVPDANFPDEAYQATVQVGGPGPGDHPAADHKIVYDYRLFMDVFAQAGFEVDLLEYCDEHGRFHYNQWNPDEGPIYRSLRSDHRNRGPQLGFVSLIIDAKKPHP